MMKVLAVVLLLAVAQLIPSCGDKDDDASDRPQVIGWVAEKRTRTTQTIPYLLVINQVEYGVPYEFYMVVGVGDLVKYDGIKWTIVRKAGS